MGGRYWVWLGLRLILALGLVAWAYSYIGTGSAEKEFQKTLDAMKQVHSFRVAATASQQATQHNEMLWEVDCDHDLLHYRWHFMDTSRDPAIDMTQDNLFISGQEYSRQSDGSWARPRDITGGSTKGYCTKLAKGEDSDLLPQIATMIKRGVLQKGDKKVVNGVRCREWLVTMKGGFSGLEHDTVCIGLADHLPYEMTVDWERSHSLYSDYNTSIPFDNPDAQTAGSDASAN